MQKSREEIAQHLFEKEGDNLMVLQLYEQALTAYTKALNFSDQWPIYVARSKCQVCLGQAQLAVEDARRALELAQRQGIEDQYKCEYQYAEALYSSGEFEEALLFYYRAFWARPVQNEYRLGIQKAEQAIVRAINAAQPQQTPLSEEPTPVLDEELLLTVLQEPTRETARCLCGCIGCDVNSCRDMYAAPGAQCICRCSGCVRHLAQRHGLVSDCSGQLLSTQLLKQDLTQTASTATPLRKTQSQAPQKTAAFMAQTQKKQNIRQMSSLQRDKELIEQLMQDPTLQKTCKDLTKHLHSSQAFVQNREQFWRQQCTEQEMKSTRQRVAAKKSTRSMTRTSQPSNEETIALMAEAADLTMSMKLERALQICAKIEPHLQQQPARIQSDFHTVKGCALYEKFDYPAAQKEFEAALGDRDPHAQQRGLRNLCRVLIEQGMYDQALPITQELCGLQNQLPIAAAADVSYRIRCLSELVDFAENKEEIQALVNDLFTILTGQREIEAQIKPIIEDSWQPILDQAPNFFQEYPTVQQMLFNGMLTAAKLAGLKDFSESERILTTLQRAAKAARNPDAERAALRSLAHLYAVTGKADAELQVSRQIREMNTRRTVLK